MQIRELIQIMVCFNNDKGKENVKYKKYEPYKV